MKSDTADLQEASAFSVTMAVGSYETAKLAPETEGCYTIHPSFSEPISIYEAAVRYMEEGVPLLVIGGRDYGAGSSRDWAAKGTRLLGIRAVLAESFERIHRSNLIGMGIRDDRINTVSYGKEFPFDPRSNPEAWERNRRAHFVITNR